MTSPTASDLRRAICCPSGECASPADCYAARAGRSYPVDIHAAASAVARLYLEAWRSYGKQAGPYSVERKHAET